jgi:hypothetical protein
MAANRTLNIADQPEAPFYHRKDWENLIASAPPYCNPMPLLIGELFWQNNGQLSFSLNKYP